jgi:hypothetical protein
MGASDSPARVRNESNKVTKARMGRPSNYKAKFAKMAKHAAKLGATNAGPAKMFGV